MNYYLIWKININKKEGSENFHQCHLVKNINKIYGKQVKGFKNYNMTGTPSVRLVRPTDNNTVVSKEEH